MRWCAIFVVGVRHYLKESLMGMIEVHAEVCTNFYAKFVNRLIIFILFLFYF